MQDIHSYLKAQLNEAQYEAAACVDTHSLIIAGAGSGKTRTLTYKIAYLLHHHQVPPQRILGVTFTNKAANEMKERLVHILHEMTEKVSGNEQGSKTDSNELDDFDALIAGAPEQQGSKSFHRQDFDWIGTFHSVFLRILKKEITKLGKAYTNSFSIYDSSDQLKLVKLVLKEQNMHDHINPRDAQRKISQRKNAGLLPDQAANVTESQSDEWLLGVYRSYQKNLEEANALDFDDLLLLPKELFTKHPETLANWQEQFDYVLVDEAQDTNAIQFELIRMLSKKSKVTLIGDDYQSIYRRRGAMMENFLSVKDIRPDIEIFKLEINYRSLPHIVDAGNAIIKQNKKQFDKTVTANRDGKHHIRVFEFADEMDEAGQVIELITKIKEENDQDWNDFTILYRTNAQSNPFEQVLLAEQIPYKVVGAYKFFERKEIKDILSYLKVFVNPNDDIGLRRVINTPTRRIGNATIDELFVLANDLGTTPGQILLDFAMYQNKLTDATTKKLNAFAQIMHTYTHLPDDKPLGELIDDLVKKINYKAHLIKRDGEEQAEERMDNIGQLINMAHNTENTGSAGLIEFLDNISLLTSLEDLQSEEADAIKLMTVHASKGLEFPYVFIVGLEENIFPLGKAKFDNDELEEERRGMYVAITRAKDQLFLSYAQSRRQWGQLKYNPPSRFLDELPQELCKVYNLSDTTSSASSQSADFDEGDRINHKLFGTGTILEVWTNIAIVKFDNPKFHIRKLEMKHLKKD